LEDLLAELDDADQEPPDVAVSTVAGWTLSAFGCGDLVWENVETGEPPRHRSGLTRQGQFGLLILLAQGDLDAVEDTGWNPGYPG
jgi:hypothetical protein